MTNFDTFGLSRTIMTSLSHMKYAEATPIQAQAIPLALQGKDVLGSAHTGTGKTAAFAIPAVEHLLKSPHGGVLVLTPTRELGKQVMDIFRQILGPKTQIKSTFLIGGEPMGKQFSQLRQNPRLVVGTPGRINDHLKRNSLRLDQFDFLVLDETDRMLDMGFSIQIDEILKHMTGARQTLMFSATMPHNIMKMADKYLRDPQRVSVDSTHTPAENIEQEIIRVQDSEKYDVLKDQLNQRQGSIVVFAKTKRSTDKLAVRLKRDGFDTDCIHGDIRQNKRERVIGSFRKQKFRILVATDVVARGLDIPHIEHVINYDLPQMAEDYVHRIGRTARAGASGQALCLVSKQDNGKWRAIQALIDPDSKEAQEERQAQKRTRNNGRKKPFGRGNPYKKGKPGMVKSRDGNRFEGKKRHDDNEGSNKSYKKRDRNDAQGNDARKDPSKSFSGKPSNAKFTRKKASSDKTEGKSFDGKTSGKKPFAGKPSGKKPGGRGFQQARRKRAAA